MELMRQMQHQEQQAHEAQTQQGASPSGGNERQTQQLFMKGFDKIEEFSGGEEQWQNWSWQIKAPVSGMNEEFAEVLSTAEADGIENIEEVSREATFVDANRERCEGQKRDARRAGEIHKFRGFDDREERIGDGRSESMGEVTCELQQKNVGTNVQSAK